MSQPPIFCSICGHAFKDQSEGGPILKRVVEGKYGKICEDCVDICAELIAQSKATGNLETFVVDASEVTDAPE